MKRAYQGYLEWTGRAACLNEDVNLFYPVGRKPTGAEKDYCGHCPVAVECLEHALDTGETDGIWGGHSPAERRLLAHDLTARMRAIDRLNARVLPDTEPITPKKKEEIIMAEDLHGEPIGDERVTYSKPPVLASVPTPGGAPLPPQAAAAARLLARTEAHPDPVIRSARKIAAQALTHLDDLVRQHEAMNRTVDRALTAVATPPPARFPKATGATSPKVVREWAASRGIEVPQFGRVPKAVVDQYLTENGAQS